MPAKQTPAISFLMAVYNGERYLQAALDSIVNQTFDDFEIIIVDDASTDSTPEILDRFSSPKMVQVVNTENIGQTRSLNKGLAACRGMYIARHDADDFSHPERLQKQHDYLQAHPEIGLLGTNYALVDEDSKIIEYIDVPTSDEVLQSKLTEGNVFCHGSTLMERKYLEKVGGYNEYFRVTQDFDLWLRLAEHCQLASLPEYLYFYRFESETVTRKKRSMQLSYKLLAIDLAEQRRTTGVEQSLPEDVTTAYIPDALSLFHHARWEAYLFYASGQKENAASSIEQALEIEGEFDQYLETNWEDWGQSQARQLAKLKNDLRAGANFLVWLHAILDPGGVPNTANKSIARFYADQTFIANQAGVKSKALKSFIQAIRYDSQWLTNRGLWSIISKSLLP